MDAPMTESPDLPDDLAKAGWALEPDDKAIAKTFRFRGFRDAMAWMARAAFEAEHIDHHPEWTNVYNRVEVRLTTHDTGGLTAKDLDLARRMEKISGRSLAK
jgi:4a-hydroxytetrahydrobiopterin dehydratase